jgi:uncharacterized membrane protein
MRENNNRRPDNRNGRTSNQRESNQRDGNQGSGQRSGQSGPSRSSHNLLPSPKVLESYEDIAPGSVSKLIEMTKKEQEHRHAWQDKYLKFHNFSYKIGLIFGFIYNIALLVLISNLIKEGNQDLALKLFAINAGLLIFAIVVTAIERRIVTRKPPRRTHHNSNSQRQSHSKPVAKPTTK